MFGNENVDVVVKDLGNHKLSIEIDAEEYYTIINSLREGCGCPDCKILANALMISRRENKRKSDGFQNIEAYN
jgi:hypothetical protein